ncbi:hypothetical protein Ddye_001283 [Dipteronia dyeriana]|uniref:DUF4283 domain-containing protein n=1 Tax=Dipteronia dyeriana TaxID=168575 RepID=A0AAE0CTD5_9ROSI|nr:hypothetical protein Ddye_001283 [Dipteronia dyeriana]
MSTDDRDLNDLEDGYFVDGFQMLTDLEFVLTRGPWVIANQYLVVQRWRSNFIPREDEIRRMPVWVRLSKLPMEWINVALLWNIDNAQQNVMEEDMDDLEVIQNLHKKMMEIEMSENQSFEAVPQIQVGVAESSNFKIVASKLKEAMEVALECVDKKGFDKVVANLKRFAHFDVFTILEPRISGDRATKIVHRLGFIKNFIVEATGFSGVFGCYGMTRFEAMWSNDKDFRTMVQQYWKNYKDCLVDKIQGLPSSPRLEEGTIMDISRDVNEEEVKAALFGIGGLKAPGLDGLLISFFQDGDAKDIARVCGSPLLKTLDNVYLPKRNCGLGIKKNKTMNQALLVNMGWQLFCGEDAKLWGILEGLIMSWNTGVKRIIVKRIIVETDSLTAVQFLAQDTNPSHPLFSLIQSCKEAINDDWSCIVHHIYREVSYALFFPLVSLFSVLLPRMY